MSAGQAADAPALAAALERVRLPHRGRGRPRTRPRELVADRAYDSTALRRYLRGRGIRAMIPERRLPAGKRRRKRGPRPRFDEATYRERAAVEQSIGWLKECRRIATRYEKLAVNFLAMVELAFIRYILRTYLSDTAYAKVLAPPRSQAE